MQEHKGSTRRFSVGRLISIRALAIAALAAMAVAAVALAGTPAATTGAATKVTDTTATLEGTVFPNQEETSYYFEYGTTTEYGTKTAIAGPLNGKAGKDVTADVTGLAPTTTYHFRVVASNASGTTAGADASFTTTAAGAPPAAQNAVTIAASPTAVTFGKPTAISGQVTGPDNAGIEVTLEENPYPYTAGFKATTVTGTTSATGAYMLAVVPTVNTRYRVTAKTKPPASSPEVLVKVRVKVGLRVSDRTPAAGKRVRFSGNVTPGHDGKVVRIQRRTSTGSWKTVARATLVAATPADGVTRSKFSKRLRINRNGTYRARLSPGDGDHAAGNSPRRRLRVH